MSKALSRDLRVRVLKAVADGSSHREPAARFGVSAASVSRWRTLERCLGDARPGPLGGDRRSARVEAQGGLIKALLEATPDITVTAAKSSAMARASASSAGTRSRAKKTAHASEQERPDVLKRRQAWFDGQLDLDPERLVFIDETWAKTNMARTHGRCRRGARLRMAVPHGHCKTTTFVAGLTRRGMVAPFVNGGPINRDAFEA
jgi:hypothetical protein